MSGLISEATAITIVEMCLEAERPEMIVEFLRGGYTFAEMEAELARPGKPAQPAAAAPAPAPDLHQLSAERFRLYQSGGR